jgi:hypothetical protein
MTTWLARREKLQQHAACIKRRERQDLPAGVLPERPIGTLPQPCTCYLKMTKYPTLGRESFENIHNSYGAVEFQDLVGDFLMALKEPHLSGRALRNCGANTLIPFHNVPVFHKIKFTNGDVTVDSIHVQPEQVNPDDGRITPAHFDMVLIQTGQQPDNAQGRL